MKNISKQTIVISIILLLIGVSVSSAISVDTDSTISDNESEECRECNEVDDRQLVVLEKQLNRLEVYSKLLLVLSKHHPELEEDYNELTDMISTLNTLDLKDVICGFLTYLMNYFFNKASNYLELAGEYYTQSRIVLASLYGGLSFMYGFLSVWVEVIWQSLGCHYNS